MHMYNLRWIDKVNEKTKKNEHKGITNGKVSVCASV